MCSKSIALAKEKYDKATCGGASEEYRRLAVLIGGRLFGELLSQKLVGSD